MGFPVLHLQLVHPYSSGRCCRPPCIDLGHPQVVTMAVDDVTPIIGGFREEFHLMKYR